MACGRTAVSMDGGNRTDGADCEAGIPTQATRVDVPAGEPSARPSPVATALPMPAVGIPSQLADFATQLASQSHIATPTMDAIAHRLESVGHAAHSLNESESHEAVAAPMDPLDFELFSFEFSCFAPLASALPPWPSLCVRTCSQACECGCCIQTRILRCRFTTTSTTICRHMAASIRLHV